MDRAKLYDQAPRLLKRLFYFGVTSATVFLFFWYFGGMNLWGNLIYHAVRLFSGFGEYQFDPGDSAKASIGLRYPVPGHKFVVVSFGINLLSVSLVEVVTLYATWIHSSFQKAIRLAVWCLLLTICYHAFHVILQVWVNYHGPNLANRYGQFYEAPQFFELIKKISFFDKLILRFWAGFPIFCCALVGEHFVSKLIEKKDAGKTSHKKEQR